MLLKLLIFEALFLVSQSSDQADKNDYDYYLLSAPNGGLWGAKVNHSKPETLIPDPWIGYPQRGMYYGAVTQDDSTGTLLLEMVDEEGGFHGLALGSPCANKPSRPEVMLERVSLMDTNNPHLSGCGEDCKWSGFTAEDGHVYFLFAGQYGIYGDNLEVRVELRKLSGCEDKFPIIDTNPVRKYGDHTPFQVNSCSQTVAHVASLGVNDNVRTGKYTLADGGDFYFQVSTSGYQSGDFRVVTRLYAVREGAVGMAEGAEVEDETEAMVGMEAWETRTQGGVAMCGDSVLCHGVFGEVRCKRKDDDQWKNKQVCDSDTFVDGVASIRAGGTCNGLYVACSSDGDSGGIWLVHWPSMEKSEVSSNSHLPVRARGITALTQQDCEL